MSVAVVEHAELDAPFSLIETMYYRHRIRLLADHLARMAGSAAHFSIPFDYDAARACIDDIIRRDVTTEGGYKVRITLSQSGIVSGTATPLVRMSKTDRLLCLSAYHVDPGNPFFHHKTTRRALYESEFARASNAGYDEVLFLNTAGMLAEGSRHNVFVRLANRIYTPPLASGVLNGVYRKHLLSRCPWIIERPIREAELERATDLYLSNAVRGLRRYPIKRPLDRLSFRMLEST